MKTHPEIALIVFFSLVVIAYLVIKFRLWEILFHDQEEKEKAQIEDILKQLYHVEHGGLVASLNAMSGALKIKHARLMFLLEKIVNLGLIKITEDRIFLTEKGRDYALKVIRVHRLWEKYLSEKTGIHKSEWHDRAERKEHVMTPEETERLYHELGSPRYDPHGDPIPLQSGEMENPTNQLLSSLKPGDAVRITHIEDEPEVIYKQIIHQKLHIDQHLHIINANEQAIEFRSEGIERKLPSILGSNIGVKYLSKEEQMEDSMIRLSSLEKGEKAHIAGISRECRGANRRRLLDLGFIKGATIETGLDSPIKGLKGYLIKSTLIALRDDQADLVLIEKEKANGKA